jgi:hypothetical protein
MLYPPVFRSVIPFRFLGLLALALSVSMQAFAHCDTMDGPVVADAQSAIAQKNVDLVLKWVRPQDEDEIRALFAKTLKVREGDPEVQELVDRHFFETLVRVHRSGEGAPYTGLKPADTPTEPGIEDAENALAAGSDDALIATLQAELAKALRERYSRVLEAKKHADENVEAGRSYVAAYVEYIHYVERLHEVIATASHGEHESGHNEQTMSHEEHDSDGE